MTMQEDVRVHAITLTCPLHNGNTSVALRMAGRGPSRMLP
jgi:hypothetical protein